MQRLHLEDAFRVAAVGCVGANEGAKGLLGGCGQRLVGQHGALHPPLQNHRTDLVAVLELGRAGNVLDGSIQHQRLQRQRLRAQPVRAQQRQVAGLRRQQEQQRRTLLANACRAAHTMHVVGDLAGRVKLQDPVHLGQVQSAGCHVSAEQEAAAGLAELLVHILPHLVRDVAVQSEHGTVRPEYARELLRERLQVVGGALWGTRGGRGGLGDELLHARIAASPAIIVVPRAVHCGVHLLRPLRLAEEQRVEVHRVAGCEEHHHLLMRVSAQEAQQRRQTQLAGDQHAVLAQLRGRVHRLVLLQHAAAAAGRRLVPWRLIQVHHSRSSRGMQQAWEVALRTHCEGSAGVGVHQHEARPAMPLALTARHGVQHRKRHSHERLRDGGRGQDVHELLAVVAHLGRHCGLSTPLGGQITPLL
mmetsp:Transcript_27348/g.38852  ORF Transcript_27348/g.38852 Transcript_27348/m.38852 type:complete len:417 (-) Transcript_27348:113-1363(-)